MAAKRACGTAKTKRVFGQRQAPAKMFRVGLYARVSTHDQQTLPLQMRAMREYAARRGWTIAAQIKEVGSGAAERDLRERVPDRSAGSDDADWSGHGGAAVCVCRVRAQDSPRTNPRRYCRSPAQRKASGSASDGGEKSKPNPKTSPRRRQQSRDRPPADHRSHLRASNPRHLFPEEIGSPTVVTHRLPKTHGTTLVAVAAAVTFGFVGLRCKVLQQFEERFRL